MNSPAPVRERFARYLIETEELAARLGEPNLRIFDTTTHLRPDPEKGVRVESGAADWRTGHIPGAGYIDLQGELSDRDTQLRFMLPTAERFAEVMSAKGIGEGTQVVLYSTTNPQWATRVWWMLRAFGFDQARVLNGGFRKWTSEARAVSTEDPQYPAATFRPRFRPGLFVDREEVSAHLADRDTCVLNSLGAEQHSGSGGQQYGRPGRIAGSVNVPAASMVDELTAYLDPDTLAAAFAAVGATQGKRILTYCGGGIAASSSAFILTLLGFDNVGLYDASLSEWAKDPSLPMEVG